MNEKCTMYTVYTTRIRITHYVQNMHTLYKNTNLMNQREKSMLVCHILHIEHID